MKRKRVTALLLVLALCIGMIPGTALAAGTTDIPHGAVVEDIGSTVEESSSAVEPALPDEGSGTESSNFPSNGQEVTNSSAPSETEMPVTSDSSNEDPGSLPEESSPTSSPVKAPQRAASEKPVHTEKQHAPNLRLLSIGQTELSATVVQDTAWHVHGSVAYRIKRTDGGEWSAWAATNTFTGLTPGVQYTIGAKYLSHTKEESYYITNYTESDETTRTVKTAATDQYIVTSEAELRELMASAPSVADRNYISVYNGNDITITQPLTIPALPEGKRLVFDLNGFTVDGSAVRGTAPLFVVQGDATVDNGTIKANNSQAALKIDTSGSLYLRDMVIQAGIALENHGTIVGMGNVSFSGGTGLVNYSTVEASAKFNGTQTDPAKPLVDNHGNIVVLDLNCKTQCLVATAIYNREGAAIGTLSGSLAYQSMNSNDNYGIEEAERAAGLLRNDGTVTTLAAAITTKGAVAVSNFGVIREITDGAKLTANGSKDFPSVALANQAGGKIEEIKGGSLTGYASSVANYGEISHISGGKFQHTSGENIVNYGTIQDIYGGGFQSTSGYKWADKKYFIVNHNSGSYAFRDGYSVSQSPITYDDGSTSGQWRMVGKAHSVTWTGMENTLTLYLSEGIDTWYSYKRGVTGQYVGSDFTQTFVEGETVGYYGYDRDRNSNLQKYVLLANKSSVSLNLQHPFNGSASSPEAVLSQKYTEIPRSYYDDIFAFGTLKTSPGPENKGEEFGSRPAKAGEAWSNVFIDATAWNYGHNKQTFGYSKDDLDSRLVNKNYFKIANTGWRDQTGKLYVTDVPTQFSSFVMADKDLTLTRVDRIVAGSMWYSSWLTNNNNKTDSYYRTPTKLRISTISGIEKTDAYPGVTWTMEYSFNGEPWAESEKGMILRDGLTPATSYDLRYCFALRETNPAFDVLPSNAYAVKISTTAKFADIPDALNVRQISATELEVTVPAGLYIQASGAGGGGSIKWYSSDKDKWLSSSSAIVTNDQGLSFSRTSSDFRKLSGETKFTISIPASCKSPDPDHMSSYSLFLMAKGSNQTDSKKTYPLQFKPQAVIPDVKISGRTGTSLTLELLGNVPEDSLQAAIKVDGEWQDWQESLSFDGLQPGTEYEIKLRTTDTEDWLPSEEKVVTAATKGISEPPQAPLVLVSRGDTAIVIEAVPGMEYSIDDGQTWQTGGEFTGLSPSTEYQIVSRYSETEDMLPSAPGEPLTVFTKGCQDPPDTLPKVIDRTDTSLTVEAVDGQEYSIDGGKTWQTGGEFTGLTPNTEYQIITRYSETEDLAPSAASDPLAVCTKGIPTAKIVPPVVTGVTETSIAVEVVEGQEYALRLARQPEEDPQTLRRTVRKASVKAKSQPDIPGLVRDWTDTGEFVDLLSNTKYEVITRLKETEDFVASDAGTASIEVKTRDTYTPPTVTTVTHTAYIYGYPDGTVRPEKPISRAEAVEILQRLFPHSLEPANTFSDVSNGKWYSASIGILTSAGKLKGYPDGTFRPTKAITRAEFFSLVSRFAAPSDSHSEGVFFSDISGHWAEESIQSASAAGWIIGFGDGTFRPNQPISRAEAVAVLNRVLHRSPAQTNEDLTAEPPLWSDCGNTQLWYYADVWEASSTHDFTH